MNVDAHNSFDIEIIIEIVIKSFCLLHSFLLLCTIPAGLDHFFVSQSGQFLENISYIKVIKIGLFISKI